MNRKAWSLSIFTIVLMSGVWPPGSAAADGRGGFGVMNQVAVKEAAADGKLFSNKDC
ncbi:MAG: hypothetical protein V3T85_12490 [Acidiferrobacterales bacterium]